MMLRGSALARHSGPKVARHISFALDLGNEDDRRDYEDKDEETGGAETEELKAAAERHEEDGEEEDGSKRKEEKEEEEEEMRFGMVKVDRVYELRCKRGRKGCKGNAEGHHTWGEFCVKSLLGNLSCVNGSLLTLETRRSGLYREKIVLKCSSCDTERRVVVVAKIMGSNKGTPSLRDGVHCLGLSPRNHHHSDSENSDSDSNNDSDSEARRETTTAEEK